MPANGKPNIEVYLVPEAPDTASKEKLGDPTGLVACGDRTYEVLTNEDLIYIDSLTLELSLYPNADVGTYKSKVRVYLTDYHTV